MHQTIVSYVSFTRSDPEGTKYRVERSVLSSFDIAAPKGAFTCLYGVKGGRQLFPLIHRSLDAQGLEMCPVDLSFPTSIDSSSYIGIDDEGGVPLADTTSINLLRLRLNLRNAVYDAWKKILGKRFDEEESRFIKFGTKYPADLAKLRKLPLFEHIDLMIYPVKTPAGVVPVCSVWGEPVAIKPWLDLPGDVSA